MTDGGPRGHRRRLLGALAGGSAALAAPGIVRAQAWPARPLRILVGYAAGGAVDVIARALAARLAPDLGQPVVVENKPGAGSNLAIRATIDTAPDGYTLLLAANAVAANMSLFKPQPFDAERDLAPIALLGRVPVALAVAAGSPYANLAALVAAARAQPGRVGYATPGNGSTPHLAVEAFAHAAGVSLLHVAYRGGAPAITDVIGGQVPVVAVNALEVLPHVRAGRLRALAVLSASRAATLPDVPTIAESGFPGFEASVWYGLMAPAATPAPVIGQLFAATQRALESSDFRDRLAAVGGEVARTSSPAQFAEHLHAERVRYDRLIRDAGIKAD